MRGCYAMAVSFSVINIFLFYFYINCYTVPLVRVLVAVDGESLYTVRTTIPYNINFAGVPTYERLSVRCRPSAFCLRQMAPNVRNVTV
jgi:hypothetical protein